MLLYFERQSIHSHIGPALQTETATVEHLEEEEGEEEEEEEGEEKKEEEEG